MVHLRKHTKCRARPATAYHRSPRLDNLVFRSSDTTRLIFSRGRPSNILQCFGIKYAAGTDSRRASRARPLPTWKKTCRNRQGRQLSAAPPSSTPLRNPNPRVRSRATHGAEVAITLLRPTETRYAWPNRACLGPGCEIFPTFAPVECLHSFEIHSVPYLDRTTLTCCQTFGQYSVGKRQPCHFLGRKEHFK